MKRLTKMDVIKSHNLYLRALYLQGDIYDFEKRMLELGCDSLKELTSDAAFEMDTTWNNMEKVAKTIKKIYESNR